MAFEFFENYRGYIHCDGYQGYDSLVGKNSEITLVGCMYHARRKFVEVLNITKAFVIGRKGWLFADRVHGAEASSIIFSLVETCKYHGVDAYSWFKHVLAKIPECQSEDEIEKLLPFNIDRSMLV